MENIKVNFVHDTRYYGMFNRMTKEININLELILKEKASLREVYIEEYLHYYFDYYKVNNEETAIKVVLKHYDKINDYVNKMITHIKKDGDNNG